MNRTLATLALLSLFGWTLPCIAAAQTDAPAEPVAEVAAEPEASEPPPSAEAVALAEKLTVAFHVRAAFDQHIQRVVMARIQGQNELVSYKDVLLEFYNKFLGWEAIRPPTVASYIKNFSEEELSQLLAFYSSDLGQKSVSLLPGIASAVLEVGMLEAVKNEELLQEMVNQKNELFQMQ
jgi:hypothetical protein